MNGKPPPSALAAGGRKAALSFLYLGVYVIASRHLPLDLIFAPSFYAQPLYRKCARVGHLRSGSSPRADAACLARHVLHVRRLAVLWGVGLVFRMRFYFVWTLSEANLTLAGFGFNGWRDAAKTDARWDRLTNGYPLKIETADSVAALMLHWNSLTSLFLRKRAPLVLPVASRMHRSRCLSYCVADADAVRARRRVREGHVRQEAPWRPLAVADQHRVCAVARRRGVVLHPFRHGCGDGFRVSLCAPPCSRACCASVGML